MNVKSWLALLAIYVGYLILGGVLFNHTECPAELQNKRENQIKENSISETVSELKDRVSESDNELLDAILAHLDWAGMSENNTDSIICKKWNFQNSLFFSFTVVTTIGYGHQFTTTPHGRMWCVAYALIGVPLNAILIGALGSFFSNKVRWVFLNIWGDVVVLVNVLSKSVRPRSVSLVSL